MQYRQQYKSFSENKKYGIIVTIIVLVIAIFTFLSMFISLPLLCLNILVTILFIPISRMLFKKFEDSATLLKKLRSSIIYIAIINSIFITAFSNILYEEIGVRYISGYHSDTSMISNDKGDYSDDIEVYRHFSNNKYFNIFTKWYSIFVYAISIIYGFVFWRKVGDRLIELGVGVSEATTLP